MRLVLLASAAVLLVPNAPVSAAPAPLRSYAGLALSPRGDEIAAIESADPHGHGAITLRAARDGHVVRTIDPCAACTYSGLSYAPDGGLAFLARDGETARLIVAGAHGLHTVATIPGLAETPRFSADGRRIAVLVTLGAAKETGATQAGVRQIGEIGDHADEKRIAVFDVAAASVAAAAVKPISPADRYIYEYDWTPDGRGFVATTALGDGDNNWWVATIDAIDATTGAVRQIARPDTQVNFPRVSPDGKTVAYIGGLMSDFGSVGGDIWTVPVAGGTPSNRTPGYKASVTSLDWLAGGIRATILSGADMSIVAFDPAKGGAVLWSRPASFTAGDARVAFAADGRTAATVVQDYEHAPAIYAGPVGTLHAVTHDNDAAPVLAHATSITWRNGGYIVQGWLLAPLVAPEAGKAPMVVDVHGGPAAASTPRFMVANTISSDLLAKGYYLFEPNPRGSYGQGEAFAAANKRDFGGGDLKDILAGIDAVEARAPVDDARLGMMGGSYGGFMAMWTNTQTDRFKAIVAGAGLSDWISYYGTNGIDQWMLPFFGKTMYDDPKAYEDVSAVYHIKSARTPTFIYVGERDIEVPPTQSVEYWHALKDNGVPTSLVIYPDEGHGLRNPDNAKDVRQRIGAWFAKYLETAAK